MDIHLEQGINAPNSKKITRINPDAIVIQAENPPRSVIDEIISNPTSSNVLSQDLKQLINPDAIVKQILLTVEIQEQSGRNILTPKAFNRSLPLFYGNFRYDNILGGTITGKGTFLSGNITTFPNNLALKRSSTAGLFEKSGADIEMDMSNRLLSHKFRTAYPYAYVTFHPDRMKEWLKKHNPFAHSVIESVFDEFKSLGEVPSYLLRISDTVERLNTFHSADFSKFRSHAEIARGSRLLLQELDTKDSLASYYEQFILDQSTNLRFALGDLSQRKSIKGDKLDAYIAFVSVMFGVNANALEQTQAELSRQNKLYSIQPSFISLPKDVGFSYITCDFEDAITEAPRSDDLRDYYIERGVSNISLLLNNYSTIFISPERRSTWKYEERCKQIMTDVAFQ
jgi:hypothetical protein